VKFCDQVPW